MVLKVMFIAIVLIIPAGLLVFASYGEYRIRPVVVAAIVMLFILIIIITTSIIINKINKLKKQLDELISSLK